LVFFGGVGLAALPIDLVNTFRKRPKNMTVEQYAERKLMIGKRAALLLTKGKALRDKVHRLGTTRPTARKDIREFNKFRAGVFIVEQEYKTLEKRFKPGKMRILYIVWDWIQLLLGFIGIGVSATWLLHIILYMAPRGAPISYFLNSMFTALDNAFRLFGVIAYFIWAFYLLWCVIKGLFKVGVRIPLLCTIHPMKVGETMMNAFLFNAFVLLLGAFGVLKFVNTAFASYSGGTASFSLWNAGIDNLRGIKYFWWYYYWGMVAMAILTAIYLFILPSDKKAVQKDVELEDLPY